MLGSARSGEPLLGSHTRPEHVGFHWSLRLDRAGDLPTIAPATHSTCRHGGGTARRFRDDGASESLLCVRHLTILAHHIFTTGLR